MGFRQVEEYNQDRLQVCIQNLNYLKPQYCSHFQGLFRKVCHTFQGVQRRAEFEGRRPRTLPGAARLNFLTTG